MESGFECGVLLGSQPSKFRKIQPYWDMLLPGWGITKATREEAIKGDFKYFYDTICRNAFPDFKGHFFDKTPRYMKHLGTCLYRAPFLSGAIIVHRDPRAVFVSTVKRSNPNLKISHAVEKNFQNLVTHYLSYFIGSISHIYNQKAIFVPFEYLVSSEDTWLNIIGNFVSNHPFKKRESESRFPNVTSSKMDADKILEFEEHLPNDLQHKILDATRLASTFFNHPKERAQYGDLWEERHEKAQIVLQKYGLPAIGTTVGGIYFEPLTYLLRYPEVLYSGLNPVTHFKRKGYYLGNIPA